MSCGELLLSTPPANSLTSVTASIDAECLSRRSITRMWFFLQAICRGVKPFWKNENKWLSSLQILKVTFPCLNWSIDCVLVTYQCPRVGFGPFVQQYFGHVLVATVCCHMQRGQVVLCHIIYLCVVLQKLLDTVHVVSLRWHVDWREAILQNKNKINVLNLSSSVKQEVTRVVVKTNSWSKKQQQEGSVAVFRSHTHTLIYLFNLFEYKTDTAKTNSVICIHYQTRWCFLKSDWSASIHVDYLGLGLDGGSMVQQDLYNPDMTISGCTVQRSQLILVRDDR